MLERTLRHEYGHVLVNQLSRGRAPVWLNEGVAIWCEEERDGDREDWAYRTLAGQVLFPLRELEGSFTRLPPERVHVAYAQSYLAVRALVDRSGGRSMRELLAALGEGKSLDEAFRDVYSRNLAGFESAVHPRADHGMTRDRDRERARPARTSAGVLQAGGSSVTEVSAGHACVAHSARSMHLASCYTTYMHDRAPAC